MALNATSDPWVAYLLEDGTTQSRLMSVALCIRSLWATLGMVFNAAIVYVTFVNKSMHGICNILIATESLLTIPMDASFHINTVIFLSGVKFITFRTCFPVLFFTNILPGNNAQFTMVLTGLDRLLSIVFPIWYKNRRRWHCFICIGILQALYGLYMIILNIVDFGLSNQMQTIPNSTFHPLFLIFLLAFIDPFSDFEATDLTLVACSSQDQFLGGMGSVAKIVGLTLSGIMMASYSLIFLFAFVLRPFAKTINDANRKLIKSLLFIIGMQLSGVFFRLFLNLMFSTYWKMDVFFSTYYGFGMSFVTIAVYSANAPVLYVFSEEYRKSFNKHFPWLTTVFTRLNAPRQQTVVVNSSTLVNNFTANTHQIYREHTG